MHLATREARSRNSAKRRSETSNHVGRHSAAVFVDIARAAILNLILRRDWWFGSWVLRATDARSTQPFGEDMATKSYISVEPRDGGRWAVQRDGTSRASSLHDTQRAAEAAARAAAKRDKTEVVIKGRDGTIQRRDSYGHDPRSRKG